MSTAAPDAMETDGKLTTPTQKKYYIDCTNVHVPKEGMELTHPLSDGMGKDWGRGQVEVGEGLLLLIECT